MKDTCSYPNCKIAKKFKLRSADECPSFNEAKWTNHATSQVSIVKDCAPKRSLLLLMDLSTRLVGVEKSQEQQRNKLRAVEGLVDLVNEAKQLRLTS